MFNKLQADLNKSSRSTGLGIFRIVFGLIALWEVKFFYDIQFLENFILDTPVKFYYDFLPISALDSGTMELLLAGLALSALCITLGIFYRGAIIYFFAVFTYLFLLDKGYYNNHLYLISLMSFLMIFLKLDSALTIVSKKRRSHIPHWQYRILQFQIIVVYFFGGISKLNPFWFEMHPVQELLASKDIQSELMLYFIMIGGLLFDLSIGFLLIWKKTRKYALLAALVFNIMNAWIFDDINIFPFFMIGCLILFIDQEKLEKYLQKLGRKSILEKPTITPIQKIPLILISVYVFWQLVLPLRHYFIDGYPDWTGEGQRFAWRMKIQTRSIKKMQFAILDLDKKIIHEIDPKQYLNGSQYTEMASHPRMIIQFAFFLKEEIAAKMNIFNCRVHSNIKVSFNGTKTQNIFRQDLDLITSWQNNTAIHDWINPLPELK